MSDESFQSLLTDVFNLILFDIDRVVDDTSLEKLLELLDFKYDDSSASSQFVKTQIFNFLSGVISAEQSQGEMCIGTISFAVRLFGIVYRKKVESSTLSNCDGSGGNFYHLLEEFIKNERIWSDPGLRDSYFKAASDLLMNDDGFLWIKNSCLVKYGLESLVDTSIFVAESCRKFIAKYLIRLSTLKALLKENDDHHECSETRRDIYSRELNGCHKCFVGHLAYIIDEQPSGLARKMIWQCSVVQLLLSLMEENSIVAQEIISLSQIVSSCFKLLNKVNKEDCGLVVDVIFTMLKNTSSWNIEWTFILNIKDKQELICLMVKSILVLYKRLYVFHAFQLIQGMLHATQTIEIDELDTSCLLRLLIYPIHKMLHDAQQSKDENSSYDSQFTVKQLIKSISRDEFYGRLNQMLHGTSKEFLSSRTVAYSLTATTELISDVKFARDSRTIEDIKVLCKEIITYLIQQSDDYFHGNYVMKYFVKFAVVCLKQDLSGEKVSATEVNEYYKLFEKLLSLSLETKILNCCFQGLQCLFSTTTTNFPTNVNMKWLNSLLTKNLCSACWDIRDSTLGFIKHLLLRCHYDFLDSLFDSNLLSFLWKLVDDNESYVRATCISAIGFLAMHDGIWKHFQEILTLTEEEVLNCILMQFKDEESAFARRATVETLCFWLERKHNIILLHLELVKSFRLTPISEVLEMASQDFDWEVKVLVLDFWKIMLQDIKWKVVPLEDIESSFINEVGKYILSAIIDCDAPVRAKGFELLNVIKTRTNEIARKPTLLYKSSIDELYNFIIKAQKDCNTSLLKTLLTVNFSDYIKHYQTLTTFRQDPIPFLRDILTAASENEDNLLDCY